MKPETAEWIEKAEGDWNVAPEEAMQTAEVVRVAVRQEMLERE